LITSVSPQTLAISSESLYDAVREVLHTHVYMFMDVTCILEDSSLNISYTVNFSCIA